MCFPATSSSLSPTSRGSSIPRRRSPLTGATIPATRPAEASIGARSRTIRTARAVCSASSGTDRSRAFHSARRLAHRHRACMDGWWVLIRETGRPCRSIFSRRLAATTRSAPMLNRFHDRNMVLVTAEARVAMMTHVDAAVFVDAGNVAPRFGDLNLDRRSVRRRPAHPYAARDIWAASMSRTASEGWRFLFRLSDPLNLARLARRTAAVPIVP